MLRTPFGPGRRRPRAGRRSASAVTPASRGGREPGRIAAKSPAVGIYQPRRDLAVGMRVRAGEKIGTVNVLGVDRMSSRPLTA
jgi:hypothetical protein